MKEYNFLKSQMKDLVDKIAIFEADQKEIEKIKIEQNHLKLNYNKLEEKYLLLEQVLFFHFFQRFHKLYK